MTNIHATCISYKRKGILILGKSGAGKSDLALRMILQKGAKLVSDDQVHITPSLNFKGGLGWDYHPSKRALASSKKDVYASPPSTIAGLLEVRGIGIIKLPYIKKQKIDLVVELSGKIDRLPEPDFWEFENCKIKKIKLNPFELSSLDKLILSLEHHPILNQHSPD